MTEIILALGILLLAYAVFQAFNQLWRKPTSGPKNGWQNEHHIALKQDNSWVENDQSVNHSDNAPPRYL